MGTAFSSTIKKSSQTPHVRSLIVAKGYSMELYSV
jgi:hypothetical protein